MGAHTLKGTFCISGLSVFPWLTPALHFQVPSCRRGGQHTLGRIPGKFPVAFAETTRTAKVYVVGGSKWPVQMKRLNYRLESILLGKLGFNSLRHKEKLNEVSQILGVCLRPLSYRTKEARGRGRPINGLLSWMCTYFKKHFKIINTIINTYKRR